MVEAHVTSLVVFHDELYVGGSLGSVGGKPAVNIASWNGVRWSTTASSLSSGVTALAVHNDQLHAATKNMVYVWNGNSWTQVGDRLYGDVNLLVSHGGRLYAGGSMSLSWNGTRYGLAVFEQHTWTLIERSMNAELTAAAVYQGEVYFARRQDNTVSVAASPDLGTVITVRESSTGWSIGAHLFALATGSMWNCREEPAATPSRPELVD
jgi:hypothetical protein